MSILQDESERRCYICSRYCEDWSTKNDLEEHHVFEGRNRDFSDRYGLTVMLCRYHHTGDINGSREAVHGWDIKGYAKRLKIRAQTEYEKIYSHEDWMKKVGKSWL